MRRRHERRTWDVGLRKKLINGDRNAEIKDRLTGIFGNALTFSTRTVNFTWKVFTVTTRLEITAVRRMADRTI